MVRTRINSFSREVIKRRLKTRKKLQNLYQKETVHKHQKKDCYNLIGVYIPSKQK